MNHKTLFDAHFMLMPLNRYINNHNRQNAGRKYNEKILLNGSKMTHKIHIITIAVKTINSIMRISDSKNSSKDVLFMDHIKSRLNKLNNIPRDHVIPIKLSVGDNVFGINTDL